MFEILTVSMYNRNDLHSKIRTQSELCQFPVTIDEPIQRGLCFCHLVRELFSEFRYLPKSWGCYSNPSYKLGMLSQSLIRVEDVIAILPTSWGCYRNSSYKLGMLSQSLQQVGDVIAILPTSWGCYRNPSYKLGML